MRLVVENGRGAAAKSCFDQTDKVDERENGNLRSPTLHILLDKPVLETDRRIAVAVLQRAMANRPRGGFPRLQLGCKPSLGLDMARDFEVQASKVPEVTLGFWMIKKFLQQRLARPPAIPSP